MTKWEDRGLLQNIETKYKLPPGLLNGVVHTESGFNPNAVSRAGAQGLMQLMPPTARGLGVTNAFDPQQNLNGGAKYLSQLLRRYKGNQNLALTAYNWGMGNVDAHQKTGKGANGQPMPIETRQYAAKVFSRMGGSGGGGGGGTLTNDDVVNHLAQLAINSKADQPQQNDDVVNQLVALARNAKPQLGAVEQSKTVPVELQYSQNDTPEVRAAKRNGRQQYYADLQQQARVESAKEAGKTKAWESALLGATDLGAGVVQGLDYLKDGVITGINNYAGSKFDNQSYERFTKQRSDIDEFHNLQRSENDQGFDGYRLAGAVASTAPLVVATGGTGATLGTMAARGAATGATLGATGFAKDKEARGKNTAYGAAGGTAGAVVGRGIGIAASKAGDAIAKKATQKVLDIPKNLLVQTSKDAGYTIPPSYSNPNVLNKTLAKVAGEADLAKIASSKNQDITNALAKQSIGLPINKPLTEAALQGVRQQAGQAYDVVKQLGKIKVDKQFNDDLDDILKPYIQLSQDFDLKITDDVASAINAARPKNGEMEASSAIQAIKNLRELASKAYKNNDVALGKATKAAAEVMEKQLERAAMKSSLPQEAIVNFVNARKVIAKTHTIEDAMNEVGDISATKLASLLGKGAPLSGDLKKAAQFASQYPQLNNVGRSGGGGVSLFDSAAGIAGGVAAGWGGAAFSLFRPGLRYAANSKLAASLMGTPKYDSAILKALQQSGKVAPVAPYVGANAQREK